MPATYITVTNTTGSYLSLVGDGGQPQIDIPPLFTGSNSIMINIPDLLGNSLLCTTLATWTTQGKITSTRGSTTLTAADFTAWAQGSDMNRSDYDADDDTIVDTAESVEVANPTSVAAAASPYTVLSTDTVLLVDTSGGAVEVDLPAAASSAGRTIVIKDAGGAASSFAITIDPNGAETIDGSAASATISADYGFLSIFCDGTEWFTNSGARAQGLNGQLQFNSSGSFAGTARASYDNANNVMMFGNVGAAPWTPPSNTSLWCAEDGASVSTALTLTTAGGASAFPAILTTKMRGTHAAPTAIQSGDFLFDLLVIGNYSSGSSASIPVAGYEVIATENWSVGGTGTKSIWYGCANGSIGPQTRHQWKSDGTMVWYSDNGITENLTIPYGEIGIRLGTATADPTGVDGQTYYKSDTDDLRMKVNGTWVDLNAQGTSGQLQFNSSGSFGGTDKVYWDDTNDTLMSGGLTSNPWGSSSSRVNSIFANNGNEANKTTYFVIHNAGDYQWTNYPSLILDRVRGTSASPTALQSGDYYGQIVGSGAYGTTPGVNSHLGFSIGWQTTETWDLTHAGTTVYWGYASNGKAAYENRSVWKGDGTLVWYSDNATTENLTIPYGEIGIRLGTATADPTGVDGQIYYKSDDNSLRIKANSSWTDVLVSAGVTTATVTHDEYLEVVIGGVTKKIMLGS